MIKCKVMGLSYNISFTIAAFIISAILLLIVSIYYSSTNVVNKRFKYFLISLVVMYALDIITVVTNDYSTVVPLVINQILNGAYFFSGAMVAIFFLYYCVSVALKDASDRTRKIGAIINFAVLGVYALSLIFNGIFGFYFFFDPNNNLAYSKGDAYLLVNLISLSYTVESLILFIVKRKQFNTKQIYTTALFYTSFFTCFILQLFAFPNTLLSDFGTAIGALIVFFSIETPDYVKLIKTLHELNDLKASLEIQVDNRTHELDEEKRLYEELTLETLSSLANLIDAKDHYTNGHSLRVAAYAKGIAEEYGFSPQDAKQIYFAGLVHDVGKIGINENVLNKPGKLSEEEYEIIKSHSSLGGNILKGIKQFPVFEKVARNHHERYDGNGYPDKLKGEDIPLEARMVAIADAYDAMTSDRIYRKALSEKVAIEELIKHRGTQFDPNLVDIFLRLCSKYNDSIKNHIDDLSKDIGDE